MPEICENWLGFLNICVYFSSQICEIYQVLSYSVDFNAPEELWNPLSKTVLSKYSVISNQETSEMTVKLKSNLYVGPVNIFSNFLHYMYCILLLATLKCLWNTQIYKWIY